MSQLVSSLRVHPWRAVAVAALVLVGTGAFLSRDLISLALTPEEPIDYTLPLVTPLVPADGEVVYRIDAQRSEVTVGVTEVLAGVDQRVELLTRGIAGDVGVQSSAGGGAPEVRLSDVAVDVHQLQSDNSLRDKAIRHQYLESHDHRQVRLSDATVRLPDTASADRVEGATIDAALLVRTVEVPTQWRIDASVDGDTLRASASTTVKMSDLGIGPITKVGLVQTGDDVDITLELVAVDSRGFSPPIGLGDRDRVVEVAAGGPAFSTEVQPILETNCASCHQSGSIGASMWTLDDAADAVEVADGLAVVTGAGYMPPWPASEKGVAVHNARGLTEREIETIGRWADAGAVLDVPSSTAVRAPEEPEVRLPRPDRVVKLAEPYKGSPGQPDDYRCFILDPEVTEPTFLTGYTFDPDRLDVVHHAIVSRVRAVDVPRIQAEDAADEGSGWSCLAGMGTNGGDRVAGWVPGQRPVAFAEGDGFDLQPGDVLVAQIHYHYEASAPPDRSGMTLELARDPAGITPLDTVTIIGPVEMPCPPGATEVLCDRSAALADVSERFGPGGGMIANALHRGCRSTPEEVARASDGIVAETTCDYPVRRPGEIVGMLGHMHEYGKDYRLTLNPDTPDEQILLDIPVWDFGWQLSYGPIDTIALEPGDTLRVTCRWDRSLRPELPMRYILFAEGTNDEMCFSTITMRPTPPAG